MITNLEAGKLSISISLFKLVHGWKVFEVIVLEAWVYAQFGDHLVDKVGYQLGYKLDTLL